MGFTEEGVALTDEEDEDGDESPIEMTLVNRNSTKGGKRSSKGKKRMRKDSDSSSEKSEKELQLFDQDEENR